MDVTSKTLVSNQENWDKMECHGRKIYCSHGLLANVDTTYYHIVCPVDNAHNYSTFNSLQYLCQTVNNVTRYLLG
jgi:hypothetical protein